MMDSTKKQLEIDFLPVGEDGGNSGDCILLRFGDLDRGGKYQKVVIIDGGYQKNAEEVKEHLRNYYNCQDKNGRFVIDCMILSHPDLDHVSGLLALAQDDTVVINSILMQRPWKKLRASSFKDGRITNHSIEERIKDSFEKAYKLHEATSNLKEHSVSQGLEYSLGEAKITILGPSENFYKQCIASCDKTPEPAASMNIFQKYVYQAKRKYTESAYYKGYIEWDNNEKTSEINESSLVILFEYDGVRILFTGDAGKQGLSQAIEYAESNSIDLKGLTSIKMPHHGSRKNVSPELMDKLGKKGTSCYISCVKDDEGHHPSKRLVNMLIEKGFNVYLTAGTAHRYQHNNPPHRDGYSPSEPLHPYEKIED